MAQNTNTPAKRKIIKTATRVFARDGLQGATTRTIAHESGVSEVTLFRLCESKEKLLTEVLAEACAAKTKGLEKTAEWTGDLKRDLTAFGQSFTAMLDKNEAMIRTLIGEARRHPAHAKLLIRDSIKPSRQRLITYLKTLRVRKLVKKGINLDATADIFTGLLLSGMLRRTSHGVRDYSAKIYLTTCVEIFAAGITPSSAPQAGKSSATKSNARTKSKPKRGRA